MRRRLPPCHRALLVAGLLCAPQAALASEDAPAPFPAEAARDAPPDAQGNASPGGPRPALESLSLEELMALPVAVAAPSHPRTAREVPSVVTVVTRDELRDTGARDLVDVLMQVPGFQPALDVQGVVGLGFRGIWGHEGKILLLLDGHEINELDYSSLPLDNIVPVDQIERIEIIRGPGSVLYGGFAELAVINVVTRQATDLRGGQVTLTYGRFGKSFSRATVSMQAGMPFRQVEGLDLAAGASLGETRRSEGVYRDGEGGAFRMSREAQVNPQHLAVALRYKDFSLRFLYDNPNFTTRDGFGSVLPRRAEMAFPSYHLESRYAWHVTPRVTLTPWFRFKHQEPWRVLDKESDLFCHRYNRRYSAGVSLSWDPADDWNVMAGVEAYGERHGLMDKSLAGLHRLYANGKSEIAYGDVALLAQAMYLNRWVNVTAGLRYEYSSQFGHSVVPRVAATGTYDWFHVKALVSGAFRSPGVQNEAINPGIRPERTWTFQLEAGARLGRWLMLTANGFNVTLLDPIVFQSVEKDGRVVETYRNERRTGSWGAEAVLQLRHPRVWANLGYAFYTSRGMNRVDAYTVPGRDDVLLAFPAHKLSLAGGVHVTESLVVSPSLVFLGERFGAGVPAADGSRTTRRQGETVLLDLNVQYRDLGVRGLDVGFGVFNILGHDNPYLQPYAGGHMPLPGPGREFVARITYSHRVEPGNGP